jgi:hypothetical protein
MGVFGDIPDTFLNRELGPASTARTLMFEPEGDVKGCPLRGGVAALDVPFGFKTRAIRAIKAGLRSQLWPGPKG